MMNRRHCVTAAAFLAVLGLSIAAAQADTWDAFAQYKPDANQSGSDTWQYLECASDNPGGNAAGYVLLPWISDNPNHLYLDDVGYIWKRGATGVTGSFNCPVSPGWIEVAPYNGGASLGWLSPISGTVDVGFQLWNSGSYIDGDYPANVPYALYKSGNDTPLLSGVFTGGTTPGTATTGVLTVSNVPVAAGQMLYMRLDPGTYTGANMTVNTVPEPGAIVLLGSALAGLLTYVWRKRK